MKLFKKILIQYVCPDCGNETEKKILYINPNLKLLSSFSLCFLICSAGQLIDLFPPSTLQRIITVSVITLLGLITMYFLVFLPSWDDIIEMKAEG